jgi:hypothetical protein
MIVLVIALWISLQNEIKDKLDKLILQEKNQGKVRQYERALKKQQLMSFLFRILIWNTIQMNMSG